MKASKTFQNINVFIDHSNINETLTVPGRNFFPEKLIDILPSTNFKSSSFSMLDMCHFDILCILKKRHLLDRLSRIESQIGEKYSEYSDFSGCEKYRNSEGNDILWEKLFLVLE